MIARVLSLAFPIILISLSGCGPAKLDVSKTYEMESGSNSIELPPQPQPQTITVEFESSNADIDIGIFKDSDAAKIEEVQYSKAIKAETKKKSGTIVAELPAKTAAKVVFETLKKTTVKVHITNRK
ncbi:MAG TPA: hypothetical protein VGL71_01270 [Urbifossiella sp.]